MSNKVSLKTAARLAKKEDAANRQKWKTADSFQNFTALMGIGTENISSGGQYGFNPITRIRTLLEWIHRGSWLGGVAVDLIAEDMTKAGVILEGDLKPEDKQEIEEEADRLNVWGELKDTIAWARLYGGCLAVHMVKGQNYATPFRVETVGKDQYKGLLVLDRWMVEPSLGDIVTEEGPYLGQPRYYTVTTNAPALREKKIHYTRCIRLEGVRLPFWQRQMENMWGISILERLYDRMLAYDSATTGVAQLIYKAYLRTIKVKDYREIISAGGPAMNGLIQYVDVMRRFQSIEGITILDAEDEFEGIVHGAFAGLSEALLQLAQQVSGCLGIPLTKLLGQSPAGLNSTGESDERNYSDMILSNQNKDLRLGVVDVYKCIAQSLGKKVPKNFGVKFKALFQLKETEKAEIAERDTNRVLSMEEAGVTSRQTNLRELRAHATITDRWAIIPDEEIEEAADEPPPQPEKVEVAEVKASAEESKPGEGGAKGKSSVKPGDILEKSEKKPGKAKDYKSVTGMSFYHQLPVVIETAAGTIRRGLGWQTTVPADYGYVNRRTGADGDQVDCYVGRAPESKRVFVINQATPATGKFDEHKCMLGYHTYESAVEDYCFGYSDGSGPQRIGSVKEFSMDEFKKWLAEGDKLLPA